MSRMRWDYMANVLKKFDHEVGAEIGVWRGKFTYNLLKLLPNVNTYYCIDSWIMYPDYKKSLKGKAFLEADYNNVFKIFKNQTKDFKDKIVTMRMKSEDALVKIPDMSLDWVFIDANHSYEYAKQDIINWSLKVKDGGIISGHDYGRDQHSDIGVTKAVDELIPNVKTGWNGVWWTQKEK